MIRTLGLLILLGTLFTSCSRRDAPQQTAAAPKPEPVTIRTAPASARTVERSISVTGSLQPDDSVVVTAEVPGRVQRVRVDFGQTVRKGDVVVELDRQEYQIQLERAQASLAQALARLGLSPKEPDATPDSTPAIRQARAQYEDARSRYENARKLVATGDIARERFTEIEKALEARRAALEAAEFDLRTQLAAVQAIKAEIRLAEKRLNDTVVRAPFDGAIAQRMVAPGQFIRDNTPLLTLVKTWPLRLRFDVPENAVASVRLGDTLRFVTDAIRDRQFTATVRELNPSLEARSRSLVAEARLNQADSRLRPGMFVQVELTIAKGVPIVTVPKPAVFTIAGLSKIFRVEGGRAREIRLEPGLAGDDWVEVPSDQLRPGDAVALDNLGLLTDGAEVRVR